MALEAVLKVGSWRTLGYIGMRTEWWHEKPFVRPKALGRWTGLELPG